MSDTGHELAPRFRLPRFRFSLLSLLILTTASALLAAWFFRPQPIKAVALLYVSPTAPRIVRSENVEFDAADYQSLQESMIRLAISDVVLNRALQDEKVVAAVISQAGEAEPKAWLRSRLHVESPQNSEVFQWTFVGKPRTAKTSLIILNGLTDAFFGEARDSIRPAYSLQHDALSMQKMELENRVAELSDRIHELEQARGKNDPKARMLRHEAEVAANQVERIRAQIEDLEAARNEPSQVQMIQPATIVNP